MNKVFLFGNLGKDPETSFLPSGMAVCKFPIATSRRFKKGEEWVEESTWHNIVVWGKRGEACGDMLRKGSKVLVEGRISVSSWEDKTTGKKVYRVEIIAEGEGVTFVSGFGKHDDGQMERERPQRSSRRRNQDISDNDEPLPFHNDEPIPF